MSPITVGVESATRLFSVCWGDAIGHVHGRWGLGREAFAQWLTQVPASSVMEARGGAHEPLLDGANTRVNPGIDQSESVTRPA